MSQSSYAINQNAAVLGLVADSAFTNTDSKVAKGAIPVGRGVSKVFGISDQVRLPAANQGTLTFDADLITSNVVNLKVNGTAITAVTFATDHATTMALLAVEIAKNVNVDTAVVSAARVITATSADEIVITLTEIVVTAGATQAGGVWAFGTHDALYGIARLSQALESGLPSRLTTITRGSLFFDADLITSNTIDMTVNGAAITQVTFATDHATTMALIIAQILLNANVAYAILDPTDTNNRTIIVTAVLGVDLLIAGITVAAGASQATGFWTGGTRSATPVETDPVYPNLDVANILRKGPIWVYFETAFDPDSDTLYCRFITGSTTELIGQFRNDADSAKAFAVAGNIQVKSTLAAAGMGIIEINRPV
ncbi:hypothetical protein KAR91_48795 [Candidatus Pacearchaeota archaeon]|nr:hypothetical protein [Candidatus Pacearchaeota archaeon]